MDRRRVGAFLLFLGLSLFPLAAAERVLAKIPCGGGGLTNAASLALSGRILAVAHHDRGAAGVTAVLSLYDLRTEELLAAVPLSSGTSFAANPKVVSSDAGFGIAWFDDEGGQSSVRFARVGTDGRIATPAATVSDGGGSAFDPVLVRAEGEWGLFWFQMGAGGTSIRFASVSDEGRLLVGPKKLTGEGEWGHYPSAAWGNGRYGVAWHSKMGSTYEVRFRTLDRNGAPLSPEAVASEGSKGAYYPSVAYLPGVQEFGLAWHELVPAGARVSSRRFGADGVARGAAVSLSAEGEEAMFPALRGESDGWSVTWADRTRGTRRLERGAASSFGAVSGERVSHAFTPRAGIRSDFPSVLSEADGSLLMAVTETEGTTETIVVRRLSSAGREELR